MNNKLLIFVISVIITGMVLYALMKNHQINCKELEKFALSDITNTYNHTISGKFEEIDITNLNAGKLHGGYVGMLDDFLEFSDGATMENKGGIFINPRNNKKQIVEFLH